MKIVSVQFDVKQHMLGYSRLLDVFKYSVKKYMPDVEFVEFRTPTPPLLQSQALNFSYNDFKLKIWRDYMEKAKDNIIFADCDMLAVRPFPHAFDFDGDIAVTWRTVVHRIPMNGGIIMAKPTEASRRFFREWYKINNKMLHDSRFHQEWRKRWAGMNQSAFGYIYDRGRHGAKIHKYKTREWNAVNCDWHAISENTVFVHYKSQLRKIVLANAKGHNKYKIAADLWYKMCNEMEAELKKTA